MSTQYSNTLHLDAQIALDHAAENLVPSSIMLALVARTQLPSDTKNKRARKKGSLTREVVAENVAGTVVNYSETNTLLEAIKNVVLTRATVEAMDFKAGEDLPSLLGEESGKALAYGADEDACALFPLATHSIAAVAALTMTQIAAAALKVKQNTRGSANRKDGGIVFVGSFKQVDNALVTAPYASGGNLYANGNVSLGRAFDSVHGKTAPTGYVTTVAGIEIYETDALSDDGTNEIAAVFNKARALIGMWADAPKQMDVNDPTYLRRLSSMYWYSDFGIHWVEAICKLASTL